MPRRASRRESPADAAPRARPTQEPSDVGLPREARKEREARKAREARVGAQARKARVPPLEAREERAEGEARVPGEVGETGEGVAGVDGERLVRAYRWMVVARRIDDVLWRLRRQGKGHFVVSSAGHEAIGAAAGLAVDLSQDFLAPHYRDLAACLAWGLQPRDVMAHYFGRAADPCTGGRQPYAHWGSTKLRIVSQEGPQPNVVTHAVGVAFANRQLGSPAIVWIAFGDGGAQKGEVHEAMNFAAIHRLPVVFCVENNLYTQSVPLRLESSVADLSLRAAGYGMPGVSVDGMDVLPMYAAADTAVRRARAGEGPTLIEARAYRFMPNTSNDDDTRYRSREEVEHWRQRDPIARLRAHLLDAGAVDETAATRLEDEVREEVAAAAAWAEVQPDAAPSDVLQHTWADRPVETLPWMRL